jgi:hypothetical protein
VRPLVPDVPANTKLGFVTRESLSLLQGPKLNAKFAGYDVRPELRAEAGLSDDVDEH